MFSARFSNKSTVWICFMTWQYGRMIMTPRESSSAEHSRTHNFKYEHIYTTLYKTHYSRVIDQHASTHSKLAGHERELHYAPWALSLFTNIGRWKWTRGEIYRIAGNFRGYNFRHASTNMCTQGYWVWIRYLQ